jgi:hypothetical protein
VPRRLASFALLLAASPACGFVNTSSQGAPDAAGESPVDAAGTVADSAPKPDGALDCSAWRPAVPFEPCDIADRGGLLRFEEVGVYSYNTTTGVLTSPGGDPIEHSAIVIDVDGVSIQLVSAEEVQMAPGAVLAIRGTKPLILVAWDKMEIAGQIDASSRTGSGPGANPADCTDGLRGQPGVANPNGGSGAGGGGLGGRGGDGGVGGGGTNEGNGGLFRSTVNTLRGGCAGGDAPGRSGSIARGGIGGGALALSARLAIQVHDVIHVGGGGGDGGEGGGGAGGGSGGMLWLDAPELSLSTTAILAANGGGGGSGSTAGGEGNDGQDSRIDGLAAVGGDGDGGSGNGGRGSDNVPDGRVGTNSVGAGGGGGGGGAGVIRVDGALQVQIGATIVPAAING